MTAIYTFDVVSTLDGYASTNGDWGGNWGKQGPEYLAYRLAMFSTDQRMVFAANTFRLFVEMLAASTEKSGVRDSSVTQMRNLPATVISTTLQEPLDWPNATLVRGNAVDVVAQ